MARPLLKRSEAIAWLPARADLSATILGPDDRFLFWPAGARNPQVSSLAALGKLRSINLVLDGRDVLIAKAQVPPLSAQKLAQALPNIVEDQLLQDASQVAIALGDRAGDGQRQLAIADRSWLEQVKGAFERRGVKVSAIWPAQLALPQRDERWTLAATGQGLTIKTNACALGWPGGTTNAERVASLGALFDTIALQDKVAAQDVGIDAVVDDSQWSEAINQFATERGLQFDIFSLPRPQAAPTDLAAAAAGRIGKTNAGQKMNWSVWRWPIWLGVFCCLAMVAGLNLMWWKLASEKRELTTQADQTFRAAFPKVSAVVQPKLQAQRLVSDLRRASGQAGSDDFAVLIKRLAEGMDAVAIDSMALIDYRSGQLRVKFQPGYADTAPAREQLKQSLLRAGLKLQFDNEREPTAVVLLNT
jgi:general secretion pathway protein L